MARPRRAASRNVSRATNDVRGPRQDAAHQARIAEQQAAEARARAIYYGFGIAFLIALTAFPTFIILAVGMAPTWVAMLSNGRRSMDRIHCIGASNLAGVMPHLMTLWAGLHSVDHALHILRDVYVWATMYLGAAAGVGALWLGPYLAASAQGIRIARRRRMLEQYRRQLVEEWGADIIPVSQAPSAAAERREPQKKNTA